MADDTASDAPALQADQFPVAGDPVLVKAEFRALHRGGCMVRIKSPEGLFQLLVVDGLEVLCPLRVGHVLETYGQ